MVKGNIKSSHITSGEKLKCHSWLSFTTTVNDTGSVHTDKQQDHGCAFSLNIADLLFP